MEFWVFILKNYKTYGSGLAVLFNTLSTPKTLISIVWYLPVVISSVNALPIPGACIRPLPVNPDAI